MAQSVYKLTIPSSTRYLEDVRHFVETHARQADLSPEAVEQLKMAVDEACTNVIEHAYKGKGEHQIDIAVIVKPDRLTVRIRDEGESFDPKAYQEPDIFEYARRHKKGGFGVHIMRRLMDQVEYRKRGKINECCMTKYRNNRTPGHGEGQDG
ncbi:ATP-binding protein [Rhodocaloribacter litoris]|uniref:ATP-binding protein n=1 Tax=Rhodocaloribacter litoris TaxID=2558931 RepID=UPI00141DDC6B|nr:ATP-binding protein [Rhodocaloribacter litoris]QXD16692.1 ATP-binding protein [Rhodocaloribacter litoris]GIV59310.1 MAG: serine-protein kinase RsbW [Rhodothermaceae bacterium]